MKASTYLPQQDAPHHSSCGGLVPGASTADIPPCDAYAACPTAQQQLAQLTAANSSKRAILEQLSQQTATARQEVLGNTLPTVLRYQSLTLSHVSAMLAREQRVRLRELMDIFPLRINAVRNSGGPIQITVCNLRLPEGAAAPAGGWPEPQVCDAVLLYHSVLHPGILQCQQQQQPCKKMFVIGDQQSSCWQGGDHIGSSYQSLDVPHHVAP
eukprot:GHUV01038612.1.p1 GENE.GHUV01038612.1~~GHUV01038612.1.p1  ORF type:complete len:212 (-),score=63.23 GHUV01038612.1:315-950(-)